MNEEIKKRPMVFPFAAVLGQEKIKNALIWNLVNPSIGGVLISGEKGTAKSTLVRGAASLSESKAFVELPLNVTEDRLVGTIDFRAALLHGERKLEPGILEKADGNILYVDEVNLLSDHIVSDLLEVAASGVNVVEREGISLSHPSRFLLVGSMNPEEGKLRPQFLDRFGLYVEVEGEKDLETRIQIMKARLEYEQDPASFCKKYEEDTKLLRGRIEKAAAFLPEVTVKESALKLASTLSAKAFCAGHRGEWAIIQTAKAIAAVDGRKTLSLEDIQTAAEYALPHRARTAEQPMQQPPQEDSETEPREEPEQPDQTQQEEQPEQSGTDSREEPPMEPGAGAPQALGPEEQGDSPQTQQGAPETGAADRDEEEVQAAGEAFAIPQWQDAAMPQVVHRGNGRRNRVRSATHQGRYVGYRIAGKEPVTDLAFDATVRAAAPAQKSREKNGRAIAIKSEDFRLKIREKRTGGCILFVVDASASMGANKRMKEVKAAILSMLNVSYQKRDRVAMIAFRKEEARLILGFTRSVELAQKELEQLPTGGRTPLAAGLELAYEVIMGLRMKDPDAIPTLVLVSDGRASCQDKSRSPFEEALHAAERIGLQKIHTIVLDTENDFIRFHLCEKLNEKLHGILVTMEDLQSEGIVQTVECWKAR